jgi:hypothetical protein
MPWRPFKFQWQHKDKLKTYSSNNFPFVVLRFFILKIVEWLSVVITRDLPGTPFRSLFPRVVGQMRKNGVAEEVEGC